MILWDKTQQRFGITEKISRRGDRVVVACDVCFKEMDRIRQQHDQTMLRKGKYQCHDCATKSDEFKQACAARAKIKWQDDEYRQKNLAAVTSEEYRDNHSKISKQLWQDPEYRAAMESQASFAASKRSKKAWSRADYREKMGRIISERMRLRWRNGQYRREMAIKQSKASKQMWAECRSEMLGVFHSESFRIKMAVIARNLSQESRDKISRAARAMWGNQAYRCRMLAIMRSPEMRQRQSLVRKGRRRPDLRAASRFASCAAHIHDHHYDYSHGRYDGSKKHYAINCPEHGLFYQSPNNHLRGARCPKCAATVSRLQEQIAKFVEQAVGEPVRINDRQIIKPYELDIFVPSKPLAIEVDGIYWHSFGLGDKEDRKRHADKADLCDASNMPFLMIRENEWNQKPLIVKSMILARLGLARRIWARKCDLVPVSAKQYRQFMDENHLQGSKTAKHRFGLVHGDEMVMAIGLGAHPKYCFEIVRMATKRNLLVVGGVSKLISHIIKICNSHQIITYADRRYSSGGGYLSAGFRLDGVVNSCCETY